MNYVVFDIETYVPEGVESSKTGSLTKMEDWQISVIGAFSSWEKPENQYLAFLEADVESFLLLLPEVDLIVGYNQMGFDLPVLEKYRQKLLPNSEHLLSLPNYDLMLEVEKNLGFKAKLDDLCKINLGTQKTDSYSKYRHYHKEGKWAELIDYCLNDVRLTHELMQKVQKNGHLLYNDLLETKKVLVAAPKAGQRTMSKAPDLFGL